MPALPGAVAAGERALRAARLPVQVEAAARQGLARRGHLFGVAPRWARLFLTWAEAVAAASLDACIPAATACEFMAVGYDLLDGLYDRAGGTAREDSAFDLAAGVTLLLLAQEELARLDIPDDRRLRAVAALARAGRRAFAGQVADRALRAAAEPDMASVLSVMSRRAGPLVAAPCQCAALLGGAHWRTVALAGHFGRALGCAAQLEDDLADRVEDASGGKKTLPLLLEQRYGDDPGLVDDAVWVLHRRFLTQATRALARLEGEQVDVEVLWTLLPADLRTV